jgi:hypothetical protein
MPISSKQACRLREMLALPGMALLLALKACAFQAVLVLKCHLMSRVR